LIDKQRQEKIKPKNEFAERKIDGWRIFYDNASSGNILIDNLSSFITLESPLDHFVSLNSSGNSKVWKFCIDEKQYVLKEYLKRSSLEFLKAFFRGSRARRAWKAGLNLLEREIATPKIYSYGEKISCCFPTRNFLVTDFIPEANGVYTFIKTHYIVPLTWDTTRQKRALIFALGKFIGTLHAKGIFHGDLRLDNIIFTQTSEYQYDFYLIDNERNRFFRTDLPKSLREKNLIQINTVALPQITLTDRLRFFKAYLNENPSLKPFGKEWMRKIILLTRQRLQKRFP
jgi:tRNA A-37 threonylcarbamoyl transferase component Bud32